MGANTCSHVQVLGHVSRVIDDLHATGYVHRDLKPGNIIWEPRGSIWVLIDFRLVADIGAAAVVGFTPTYAAPEAAQRYKDNARKMTVGTELDAWSLGVVALELMLGKPPFGKGATFLEVCVPRPSRHAAMLLLAFCKLHVIA